MTTEISNSDSTIDSREIIERIADLESIPILDREEWEQDELDALGKLEEEYFDSSEWASGVTLINDNYFTEYAEELAGELGMVDEESAIYNYIDWERWAEALKTDYTELDFDGATYYAR